MFQQKETLNPSLLVNILMLLLLYRDWSFFGITFDAHPHSGWFICHAPTEHDVLKVT